MKNFFENIKFYVNKTFSNPMKVKGKCRACGECCRTIVFYVGENPVSTNEQFELLKKWDKKYYNFIPNGIAHDGALYFKCKFLKDDGKCKVYPIRSISCRMYPKYSASFFTRGNGIKECCGYYLEPSKNFKDFLK